MTETQLDSFPVSQLQDRYGIVRSAVYARLEGLKIKPEKQGNRSFVNADQLTLLDELNDHIKAGGTLPSFLSSGHAMESSGQSGHIVLDNQDTSSGHAIESSGQSGQALITLLESMTNKLNQPEPLANLKALQEACDKGWLLSTSQLAPLVGISRKELASRAKWERFGFTFSKSGKNGAEIAWKVSKQ